MNNARQPTAGAAAPMAAAEPTLAGGAPGSDHLQPSTESKVQLDCYENWANGAPESATAMSLFSIFTLPTNDHTEAPTTSAAREKEYEKWE